MIAAIGSLLVFVLCLVAGAVALAVLAVSGIAIMRGTRSSLVPRGVRKRLNRDMEEALEREQIDTVKRKWMEADGWTITDWEEYEE
ncbi:MAG: hypothetical protein AAF958_00835 [Planctomycetota bacterium]